jgi:hypothetical protein
MTHDECKHIMLRLLDGRSMTITEIRRETGFTRDMIGGAVKSAEFEPDGLRKAERVYRGGSPSTAYKVRADATPDPLKQPTNPIIDAALADNDLLIQAIRLLARRGHRAAALQVAAAWRLEDARLKQIFEGRRIEEETYDRTNE